MRDPKKILTKEGYRKYLAHLQNMKEAATFLMNHTSDLEVPNEDYDDLACAWRIADHLERLDEDPKGYDK